MKHDYRCSTWYAMFYRQLHIGSSSRQINILRSYPQAEFAKDGIVHGSIDWNLRMSSFEEGMADVESQRAAAAKFGLVD